MEKEMQVWFDDVSNVLRVHDFNNESAIFYKGFKLSRDFKNNFKIVDTRFDDDYQEVKPKELEEIREKGFIRGVDEINQRLSQKRLKACIKKVETYYAKKKRAKREMHKDVRLNKKRIRNLDKNIDIVVDEILLHRMRISQFNNKYN